MSLESELSQLRDFKVEVVELRKRLECPKVEWRRDDAWMSGYNIGDVTFSAFNNAYKGWLFGVEADKDAFDTIEQAKSAVESAWMEFWNKTHEVKK